MTTTVDYPRPPLIHDHRALFQEPAWLGGQPYPDGDDSEEDDDETDA